MLCRSCRNSPDSIDGSFEATIDLSTDTSYDPAAGDWWIHVSTLEEATYGSPLVTAQNNIDGDGAGNFSVGDNDMHFHIFDASDVEVFSLVEDDFGGISSKEISKLEADPTPYLNKNDYNDGTSSSFGAPTSGRQERSHKTLPRCGTARLCRSRPLPC
jgi:hypothetical protein